MTGVRLGLSCSGLYLSSTKDGIRFRKGLFSRAVEETAQSRQCTWIEADLILALAAGAVALVTGLMTWAVIYYRAG